MPRLEHAETAHEVVPVAGEGQADAVLRLARGQGVDLECGDHAGRRLHGSGDEPAEPSSGLGRACDRVQPVGVVRAVVALDDHGGRLRHRQAVRGVHRVCSVRRQPGGQRVGGVDRIGAIL